LELSETNNEIPQWGYFSFKEASVATKQSIVSNDAEDREGGEERREGIDYEDEKGFQLLKVRVKLGLQLELGGEERERDRGGNRDREGGEERREGIDYEDVKGFQLLKVRCRDDDRLVS
jgi:hypothetical protein